jgi:hypothetical protein
MPLLVRRYIGENGGFFSIGSMPFEWRRLSEGQFRTFALSLESDYFSSSSRSATHRLWSLSSLAVFDFE